MNRAEFEARVGTKIRDKWTLEKLLGVGGMAAVYLARHKIGRVEAIKLLHPEIAVDEQVRARFEQEAMAVNSIGHPGVVEIRDIDQTDDDIHFMVMELLDGETLADRYERDGELRLPWLLKLIDQLLDVLIACHAKSVIHRDIKPENLFIQEDGQLKVLDFGIARMRDGLRTQAGTMLGTVAFSPPEQLKGEEVDARADLFAVGATMFTVIAGRRVHETADPARLALKMMREPAPPLHDVAPHADANVCMLVDRALAYLPERRYPDARTMRGDVWAVQKGQRPPYAYACEQSGLDPHVTISTKPTKSDTPPSGPPPAALPTTAPQMPAYLDEPGFLDQPASKRELPTTQPQMPAFLSAPAPSDESPAASEQASSLPPSIDPASQPEPSAAPPPSSEQRQATLHGIQPQKHLSTDPRWPARKRTDDDALDGDDELDIPVSIELPDDDEDEPDDE